ncbi:Inner membrane protein YohD [bacterium HR10]|nr:Inner membrane protein YohD [bacterium HR10]
MDASIESHIRAYGYWGVFLWAVLGGEESVVVAVWLVKRGLLNLPGVIVAAALGGAAGDQIYFFLARRYGWSRLRRSARFRRSRERAEALVARYGPGVVLASRFLAGLRITIPLVCGTLGMPALTYSVLNLVSAFLWASFYSLAVASLWSAWTSPARRLWVVGAVIALLALVFLIRFWRARGAHRRSSMPACRTSPDAGEEEESRVGIRAG